MLICSGTVLGVNNEKRAKALPDEYVVAYKLIRKYLWNTAGITSIDPLIDLVDLLEEAAASEKAVIEITGPDVAAFADELVKGERSYASDQRRKLNDAFKQ